MDAETESTPPPKSKVGTMLGYAGMLAIGLGGGYGASLSLGGGQADAAAPDHGAAPEAEHGAPPAGEHGEGTPAGPTGPTVANLGTFTVNLRGSGGGRILRMEVQLDASAGSSGAVESHTAQLRDSVLSAVSDYTWSELEGTDGKTRLKDELLARVNGVVAPATIDQVYFTQFVVQ